MQHKLMNGSRLNVPHLATTALLVVAPACLGLDCLVCSELDFHYLPALLTACIYSRLQH